MKRLRGPEYLALLLSVGTLSGCRVPQVVNLGSTSVTVPADWHEYASGTQSRATALQLRREGIPLLEKDSFAGFYASSNPATNTEQGAQAWQERMLQPPKTSKTPAGLQPRVTAPFLQGKKEQVAGKYVTLCVTSSKADSTEVLNCVVVGAPVMFSFAGSSAGADEARGMLRSLQ